MKRQYTVTAEGKELRRAIRFIVKTIGISNRTSHSLTSIESVKTRMIHLASSGAENARKVKTASTIDFRRKRFARFFGTLRKGVKMRKRLKEILGN